MIARFWHGWTTPENADAYQEIVTTEVIPEIIARQIAGFSRIELFRREAGAEVEFVTIMWFENREAIERFVGADVEIAHVPPRARAVLLRFDERSQHFEQLLGSDNRL